MSVMAKHSLFLIAMVGLMMMTTGSVAFAPSASTLRAYAVAPGRLATTTHSSPIALNLAADNKNDEEKKNNDVSDDGDMGTFASQRNSLFFVSNLQSAIVAAAWAFLALGFILNIFGYDYVMKDGKLSIDTLEAAQFQQEVVKASKQAKTSK